MPFLEINGRRLDLTNLDEYQPSTPFESSTINFIRQWQAGADLFELQTSGSTGKPKLIQVTREQMTASARFTIKALKLKRGTTALVCLDTAYIAGKMMLVRGLLYEMNLIIQQPSSNPLKGMLVQPEFAALVPLQLWETLNDPGATAILNNMKAVIIGGAPIDASLQHELQHIKAPLYATYGMTETVSHIAFRKLNGANSTIYKAFEEVQLGQDDRECLTIRSVLTNHKTIVTNDRVRLHGSHQFEWIGRVDNVINTGGVKVQAEEIENVVKEIFNELSITCRCFIAGASDTHFGEKITLVIESPVPLPQEKEVIALLKSRLSSYEVPRSIFYCPEFVETPTGKINRRGTLEKRDESFFA